MVNQDKYYYHEAILWLTFARLRDLDNPINRKLINVVGKDEIQKRFIEYQTSASVEYHKNAIEERKLKNKN